MKTFKEFQKDSGKLVAGYASIGHYKNIDIPEHPDNLPIGYFSIGNRPEVIIKNQLKEWIYDKGFDKDDYEANPQKFALPMAMNEHPDRDGSKLNKLDGRLEDYYHQDNYHTKKNAFNIYSYDSHAVNKHLIDRHIDSYHSNDEKLAEHIGIIDTHLDNYTKPAPVDFHVYSGIGDSLHVHHIRQNNSDRLYLPAYTSTSLEPTVAEQFTLNHARYDDDGNPRSRVKKPYREIIRFHIPKDSEHGTYLGSTGYDGGNGHEYEFLRGNGHEYEFLLHRGTHIQFLGKPRIYPMHTSEDSPIIVHDAKIIKHVRSPI